MPVPLSVVALDGPTDPERIFAMLARDEADVFWLDAGPAATSGWSWVGAGVPERSIDAVRAVALSSGPAPAPHGGFLGGWVGWFGYEDAAGRAGAPVSAPDPGIPQQVLLRVVRYVAFDHASGRAWAFAAADEIDAFAADALSAPPVFRETRATDAGVAASRDTPEAYAILVKRCRDAIEAGDAYQLCLTTRFSVRAEVDPLAVYGRLRRSTPAHHGGLIISGDVALVSASPERFLEVSGGRVTTRPIKGTRPRGRDADEDAALLGELQESAKERAENIMIVDLMRNDLSRVCAPGSVAVGALLDVESYPAVHQLVSTVSGILCDGTDLGALLDATFPAGSMTGAPKLSAMTILHSLESRPRGVFAGAFGWIGEDGALDLAMVIRSIVVHPGGAYVGAGGGITWQSDPLAEVAEVGVKARGPLAALGARLPLGW